MCQVIPQLQGTTTLLGGTEMQTCGMDMDMMCMLLVDRGVIDIAQGLNNQVQMKYLRWLFSFSVLLHIFWLSICHLFEKMVKIIHVHDVQQEQL